jgi:anaerobic selenocysteine-containing dehydrogenase
VPLDADGKSVSSRVVIVGGKPALSIQAGPAEIFVDARVNAVPVKSVLQLLKDRVDEHTLGEYAEIAGVRARDLKELAFEFTAHGKKAAAEFYRGPVQHTNGYYNAQAIITLNVLLGNVDWKGGLTKGGGHWHEDGSKPGAPFPKSVIKSAPGGLKKFGVHVNREGTAYEKTTLFEGYPAKRPWYPFTGELYQNVIPSAAAGYPYPIKVLFIQKGTPILASPAGHAQIDLLRDPTKIPLVIACDVVIGETSMYADYIMPDLTYMERWGAPHISPDVVTKVSKIRQPMVAPLTEIVEVDGEVMPISLEAFLLAVGKALNLPGIGPDALGAGYPFDRPEQYYLAMAANLAFGDKEDGSETLPAVSDEEMQIFRAARSHLPKSVFDEAVWSAAVPDTLWGSVVTLLNHGGRFEAAEKAYKGDYMAHQWKGIWNLYVEKVAKGRNAMTGEHFDGLPKVEPITDAAGQSIVAEGYDLTLITYKEITGGQSRTHGAYWLGAVLPENFVLINSQDATRLGVGDGDEVRVESSSLPEGVFDLGDDRTYAVVGKVKIIEGIRPGTIAISWSYGHWAYGSNNIEINGETVPGDPRRGTGIVPNPAMWIDPVVGDVCLTDPIGGSASFYDTQVRLKRI